MPGDPRIRASDADRDRAAALLREHHAAGRLTAEEFRVEEDLIVVGPVFDVAALGDLVSELDRQLGTSFERRGTLSVYATEAGLEHAAREGERSGMRFAVLDAEETCALEPSLGFTDRFTNLVGCARRELKPGIAVDTCDGQSLVACETVTNGASIVPRTGRLALGFA